MIDCHCHFDMMDSPERYLAKMERLGHTIIGMTNRPCFFIQGLHHINPRSNIRLALGLHPLQLDHFEEDIVDFKEYIDKTTYIGEIGLDCTTEGRSTFDRQIDCLEEILRSMVDKNKILSVHSRQAENEVLNLLDLFFQKNVIFHWYSGDAKLIPEIVEHGYYFSVNEAMLYSPHGRELISHMPKERVLTESDAPFNSRADIRKAIEGLAGIWRVDARYAERLIEENFKTLLRGLSE